MSVTTMGRDGIVRRFTLSKRMHRLRYAFSRLLEKIPDHPAILRIVAMIPDSWQDQNDIE